MDAPEILWWSNHGPLKVHLDLLKKMYGDNVRVNHIKKKITAEKVEIEYFSRNYRDLYVAGPWSVMAHIAALNIEPLIEDRVQVHRNNADYSDKHTHWKVLGFKTLESIAWKTRPAVAKP